ncbi:MAG: hypothetical protein O7C75_20110, partial [Verrucomicrobia bacterium]|nr:hypothetical protein [Verrucomicrobiota bacterium]
PADLPQDVLEEMALIEQQVIELRELQPNGEILRILYTSEQLRERVIEDFFSDYTPEEAALDTMVLALFGLIEPETDLLDIYIELYSEGIAGFYDDETGEMVVVGGAGFGGAEHITYAHEFVHVLQDQTYDFDDGLGYNDETCEEDSEFCLALQALIEGDASFSEFAWFINYATEEQTNDLMEFYNDFESPAFDSSPAYLQQDLLFPYIYGQEFVSYLYDRGGWISVDSAYSNPPVSTEQILHPERYPNDVPVSVILPDLLPVLGFDWELLEEDTLGEWFTFLILAHGIDGNARLSEFRAQDAAEGWGGDAYAVYQDSQTKDFVLVVQHVWDSVQDANEYAALFQEYAIARFGNPVLVGSSQVTWLAADGFHVLYFDGELTTWIFATDEETATAVWDAVQSP